MADTHEALAGLVRVKPLEWRVEYERADGTTKWSAECWDVIYSIVRTRSREHDGFVYAAINDFHPTHQAAEDAVEAFRVSRIMAQLEPVDPWRPIETAPKDGSVFLAAWANKDVTLCKWNGRHFVCEDEWHACCSTSLLSTDYSAEITHWQPLPQTPQQDTPT